MSFLIDKAVSCIGNKKCTLTIALFSCIASSQAETYQTEIDVVHGRFFSEFEYLGSDYVEHTEKYKSDATALAITYHLAPVDDSLGPLREADFLSQSSLLSFQHLLESDSYSLSGRFVSKDTGWFSQLSAHVNIDYATLTLGKYLSNNTTVGFSISNDFQERHDTEPGYQLHAKTLRGVGQGAFLNLEAELHHSEVPKNTNLRLLTDYFFNDAFSIGAGFILHEDSDYTEWMARSSYFFTPQLGASFSYASFSEDGASYDYLSENYNLSLKARF